MIKIDNESSPLLLLFKETFLNLPDDVEKLSGSGSNRGYYRLQMGKFSAIGVKGESLEENRTFIKMATFLTQQGLPVPRIYAVSKDEMYYLQQDLGSVSLFDLIQKEIANGFASPEIIALLKETVKRLIEIQVKGSKMDFEICFPEAEFDATAMMWDLNYFKYCFLKSAGIPFDERRLEGDFQRIVEVTSRKEMPKLFMYRDFQSRNVMVFNNQPYLIDFQGGRKGPMLYDVVSFLWQAKAQFPDALRKELLNLYVSGMRDLGIGKKVVYEEFLPYFVLLRQLQTLGAYGLRGFGEGKSHFLESVPFALREVMKTLERVEPLHLGYLRELMTRVNEKYTTK